MEGSDDELDLIRHARPVVDIALNARPSPNELNKENTHSSDEEIVTSDPDELAEIAANRSLEKYSEVAPGLAVPKQTNPETQIDEERRKFHVSSFTPGDLENLPSPLRRARSRPPALDPSSSPTQLSRHSDEDLEEAEEGVFTDAPATPQSAPLTSSPDSMRQRFSPPRPLHRLDEPTEDPHVEETRSQSSASIGDSRRSPSTLFTPLIGSHMEDMDRPASEMSLDSRHSNPATPPRAQPTIQLTSPASLDGPQAKSPARQPQTPPHSPAPLPGPAAENSPAHPSSPSEAFPDAPHRRTLRTRTARQQHPYAIEYAQYKRSMLQAGLSDAILKLPGRGQQEFNTSEKHPKQMNPEMQGFIVPEDEESQDLYVPPPSPREERPVDQPSMNIGGFLEGFGGMLSDEETPADRQKRRNATKEKESPGTKEPKPKPKPFPRIGIDKQHETRSSPPLPSPRLRGSDQLHRLLPSPSKHSTSPNRTPTEDRGPKPRVSKGASSLGSGKSSKSIPTSDSEQSAADSASSSSSIDSIERKRLRILNRMMPAAWIRRQLEQTVKKEQRAKKRRIAPTGTTGTKRNAGNLQQPLVLVGDSESDDELPSRSQHNEESPQTASRTSPPARAKPSRIFPRRRARILSDDNDDDIVEISSSDGRSSPANFLAQDSGVMDDDEISTWLTRKNQSRSEGSGDLINRMLSRTSGTAQDPKRTSRKSRTGYNRDGTKLKQAKLTSMFRASSPEGAVIEVSSDEESRTKPTAGHTRPVTKNSTKRRTTNHSRPQRTLMIRGDLAELLDANIAPNPELRKAKDRKSAHNRAVSTSNLQIREGHGLPSGTQTSSSRGRLPKMHPFNHKSVSADCGILPFKPQTKFLASTYLARGLLQNLLDVAAETNVLPAEATPVVLFGEHLNTRTSGINFVEQVRRLIPLWTSWLLGRKTETEQNVQRSFRFVVLRVTHLLGNPPDTDQASSGPDSTPLELLEEDATEILTMVIETSRGDPALKDVTLESSYNWLAFHWFVVELAVRVACGNRRRALRISESAELNTANLDAIVQLLIRVLLGYNISDRIQQAQDQADDIDDPVLETWICLLYLIDETEFAGATRWKPLWTRIELILDTPEFALSYKVFESERRWEHIFALCALSAFSCQTGRLLPSHVPVSRWPWVCKTIKDIRLKEDNTIAGANARQQRVDFYVRTVTARCWLLHTMWGWDYRHHDRLFAMLHPIFQSRKLSKLRDEKTDFPTFIRHLDLEHLDRFSHGDTAWSMFLKIFRRAIIDDPGGARKLYSICTPIGVLNFTDENPATDLDLSRLLNRFAIFLIILITDPSQERAADCIKRIQALISFPVADMRSREACIRAFQYTGLLLKFFKLDLTPLVDWMHNMIDSLQTDMKKHILLPQRNRLAVLVLCLVRSAASIVSTSGFDRDSARDYPETTLLTSALIQVMFQVDLKNNAAARREIRLFLEAFCHARDAFIATLPPKPAPVVIVNEESQESNEFDEFELDLNDPEVLAGLDALEGETEFLDHNPDPLISKEKHAAEIINNTVSPAIFENVILGFGLSDYRLSGTPEREDSSSEEYNWVRVWVGCLKIVVENHQRTWWDYLGSWGNAKQERISRIIDVAAERRVRIQFCYLALKYSPNLTQRANKEQKHQFILPWFQCLPHHRYTIEHKYTALICDRGLASDPILEGLPTRINDNGEYYVLSTELMAERIEYTKCALTNLARLSRSNQNTSASTDLTRGRACVAKLFETMKHTWEHLNRQFSPSVDKDLLPSYLEFCCGVRKLTEDLLVEASVKDLRLRLTWVSTST